AYAKEDPIRHLIGQGMTDLHRYFHADSSYSYVYHGEAGYLDHVLCNSTLLPQITGIQPYHINSDEHDNYTYDGSKADETMFRSSDHDPILVGLKLAPGYTALDNCHVTVQDGKPVLYGAEGGFFQLYNINGQVVTQGMISSSQEVLPITLPRGFYIFCVSVGNEIQPIKIVVH
ncbi:MAG: T9SS type A sorting domain-containing protein, partial [Paludibacteraceae bacterium]|nr:T9SS type A sorting domain-containing protein [Paludibacteraceae bacterium]